MLASASYRALSVSISVIFCNCVASGRELATFPLTDYLSIYYFASSEGSDTSTNAVFLPPLLFPRLLVALAPWPAPASLLVPSLPLLTYCLLELGTDPLIAPYFATLLLDFDCLC